MKRLLIVVVLLAGCGNEPNDAWQGYIEGEDVLLASPYAGRCRSCTCAAASASRPARRCSPLEQEAERAGRVEGGRAPGKRRRRGSGT